VVPHEHYLRCWNCLDHWGRFCDIAVSDPWTERMVVNERKGVSGIMIRTEVGREVVDSAVNSGAMVSEPIGVEEMLGYNAHLVIKPDHPRHGWMAGYQLIFNGRLKALGTVLGNLLRKKRIGLKTTLKARFDRQYYR
jgi:hypothetical protein